MMNWLRFEVKRSKGQRSQRDQMHPSGEGTYR